jgi:uncharacterized protein (TIGR03066 family)
MSKLGMVLAGVMVLSLAAFGTSQDKADNKTKIVGVWEVTKGDAPPGATLEFTKDGKLKMMAKLKDQTLSMEGTYKIDGDKMSVTLKLGDKEKTEALTIKTLTDKVLVTVDSKGQADEFKRK